MKRNIGKMQRCLIVLLLLFVTSGIYAQTNRLLVNSPTVNVGEKTELSVVLENESTVAGGQFELLLPAGLQVEEVAIASARADGHKIDYRYTASTGKLFVMFYAQPVKSLKGDKGELVKISVNVPGGFKAGSYPVSFGNNTKLAADALTSVPVTGTIGGNLSVNVILVESIAVSTAEGVTEITPSASSLHLRESILPENASSKEVEWSVVSGSELVTLSDATLSANGSNKNGTAKIRATAKDGSGKFGELTITVKDFVINATSVTLTAKDGVTEITPAAPSLTLEAKVLPADATDQSIVWSLTTGSELVNLSQEGVLTANGSNKNGAVVVRASLKNNSNMYAELSVTVKDFTIKVTSITVSGQGGVAEITPTASALQLEAVVLPADASNKEIEWSVVSGSELATLSPTGLLSANGSNKNGEVRVRAAAKDGSGISGELTVAVKGFVIGAASVAVSAKGGVTEITPSVPSLQLEAKVLPEDAADKKVTWSLTSGSELVALSADGIVTANGSNKNGTVVVRATLTNAPTIFGELTLTVKGFTIKVSSVTVSTQEGGNELTPLITQLQLIAKVLPEDADNKEVTWSITSGAELISLSATGLVASKSVNLTGTAVVCATAKDGSGAKGEIDIKLVPLGVSLIEYFIDTDPGYGKGIPAGLPVDDKRTFTADLKGVPDGFHTLYVRARDSYRNWSQTVGHTFLKVNGLADKATLTETEYFIDTDPGYGNAIIGNLPNEEGEVNITAGLSDFPDGFHTFYIRAKDSFGSWGHTVAQPFLKTTASDIVKMEYYFDTDPGEGKAYPVLLPVNDTYMEIAFTADLTGLTDGNHTIFVRAANEEGMWGVVESAPFSLITTGTKEVEWLLPFDLYPSPADTECFVSLGDNTGNNYQVSIFTLSGQKVFDKHETVSGSEKQIKLDTHSLPDGIYLVTVLSKERKLKATKRLVVLHK